MNSNKIGLIIFGTILFLFVGCKNNSDIIMVKYGDLNYGFNTDVKEYEFLN